MAYTDVFRTIKIPEIIPQTPAGLIDLAVKLVEVPTKREQERERKAIGLKREGPITSSDGRYQFPVVSWQRRIDRNDVYMSIVDKRAARAGILLTARAGTEWPVIEVVKIIVVNDYLAPCRGLSRVINHVFPSDVASDHVDDWQRSEVRWPLDSTLSEPQTADYVKAIATIL
jgi:hypothetical protein